MATTTEGTRTAEEVARSYFAAIAARDAAAAAAHWNAEGVDDLVSIRVLRGPGEIRAFFEQLFAAMPDLEYEVERVTASGAIAAVEWRMRGTFSGGPFEGVEPTGAVVEMRGADCVEVEDGRIVANTAYSDGAAFARAVGLMPAQGSGAERTMLTAFNGATKLRAALRERLDR